MRLSSLARTLLSLLLLAGAGSCAESTTTGPTPTDSSATIEVLVDLLAPGGSTIATLSLPNDSTAQLMLAGEVLTSSVASVSVPLKMEIGNFILDGTDCGALDSVTTEPRFTAQLQRFLKTGVYCIKVSDPNNVLPETVGVVLRLAHPVPKFFAGTVSPVTFTSTLPMGGTVTKTVTTSTEGTIDVTLNSLGSQGSATVNLGMGVVPTDSATCTLTRIVPAKAGTTPQLSVKVDAGSYCVALIDSGNLKDNTTFSLTVAHP